MQNGEDLPLFAPLQSQAVIKSVLYVIFNRDSISFLLNLGQGSASRVLTRDPWVLSCSLLLSSLARVLVGGVRSIDNPPIRDHSDVCSNVANASALG